MNEVITLIDDIEYRIRKEYMDKMFSKCVKKDLHERTTKWEKVY